MVEEKWLKILEGPATITLGVRFLAEMESWILQVSFRTFSGTIGTSCKQSQGMESEPKESYLNCFSEPEPC
jgi:hypothetical protein